MKKLSLIALMMLLTLLSGCSQKSNSAIDVTPPLIKTRFLTKKIPAELLEPTKAPNPELLKGVKVCSGEARAKLYVKRLLLAWYENKEKIESISELEDLK